MEQRELNDSLRMLNYAATQLVLSDFSWPPADDATVTQLLDAFPPPDVASRYRARTARHRGRDTSRNVES